MAAAAQQVARRRPGGAHPTPHPAGGGVVPFVMAAHEHTEPMADVTVVPSASAQQIGPLDVPASGYLRHLWIQADATGGTIGAGVLSQDYPFNWFGSVLLSDVNGAPLVNLDGYSLMWANIIGAYGAFTTDPRTLPNFVGTINSTFRVRVPVEIAHHNGYGALGNQNAAASYKLTLVVNPSGILYTTAPTTVPTALRVRVTLEAWTQPAAQDVVGRPQQPTPPGHGTTQYWSFFVKSVATGQQTVLLPRVGNLLRAIIVIARSNAANTPRTDNVFPDPVTMQWDNRNIHLMSQAYNIDQLVDRTYKISARDTGVFAFMYDADKENLAGDDDPTLWLPTTQSTRLELDGPNVTAGNLTIVTCDVAPVEVDQSQRFVETSRSGFHPQVGSAPVAAQ